MLSASQKKIISKFIKRGRIRHFISPKLSKNLGFYIKLPSSEKKSGRQCFGQTFELSCLRGPKSSGKMEHTKVLWRANSAYSTLEKKATRVGAGKYSKKLN